MLPGRPQEGRGDAVPRWMAAPRGPVRRARGQNPAYRPAPRPPSPDVQEDRDGGATAEGCADGAGGGAGPGRGAPGVRPEGCRLPVRPDLGSDAPDLRGDPAGRPAGPRRLPGQGGAGEL